MQENLTLALWEFWQDLRNPWEIFYSGNTVHFKHVLEPFLLSTLIYTIERTPRIKGMFEKHLSNT
jgi:hypothetical protein